MGEKLQAKQLVMQLVSSRLELDVVSCDVSLRVSDGSDGSVAIMLLADLRKCIMELVGGEKKEVGHKFRDPVL